MVVSAKTPSEESPVVRFARSLRVQLNAVALIFVALPIALYSVFNAADREKQELVLNAIRDNGLLIAQALTPILTDLPPSEFGRLPGDLARYSNGQRSVKLLFKPTGASGQAGFFYVASAPPIPADALGTERQLLVELGVLDRLAESCSGNVPLSKGVRVADGTQEILTSVSPIQSASGCWAVVAAADQRAAFGVIDERAYWERPESRIALGIYACLALLSVVIFVGLRSTLAKLAATAQSADQGAGFEQAVAIPELRPMAREFDRLVARLNGAAAILRQSAEDNAHAFKAPIAVIRQSVEPLRAAIGEEAPSSRALAAITASIDRLDGLVRSARRLDSAAAEMLESGRQAIDLSSLVTAFAEEFEPMHAVRLTAQADPDIRVAVDAELVETILENLVENAVSFSPPNGVVAIRLTRDGGMASLSVLDDGPGVPPDRLTQIFERYYSDRPGDPDPHRHYGVGLSLVRQNALAMGGSAVAENRAEGGLAVTVRLPLATGTNEGFR